jgi:hypothetical protein
MHLRTVAALTLALASTTLVSLAYLREHGAVAGLPALTLRHPLRGVRALLGDRSWLTGFAMEGGGFAMYVAALGLAPLALVQGVAAGGVGVLAFLPARLARKPLSRSERGGAALAVGGLGLLAVSLSGGEAGGSSGALLESAIWLAAIAALAIAVLLATRGLLGRDVRAGVAGGLFFAAGDISTKLATAGGTHVVFVLPLIAGYLLGTSLLQIGYQSGTALTVAGIATLLTNALPIAAGTLLLHESLPGGVLGGVRVLAFLAVIAGAILLARRRSPAG